MAERAGVPIAMTDADLWDVVAPVWRSLLKVHADPDRRQRTDDPVISASVTLSGSCDATLELVVGMAAARSTAHVMLALPAGEPASDIDVEDALGELANVLGGNLQARVPGPTCLSLPSVQTGRAHLGSRPVASLGVRWADAHADVVLHAGGGGDAPVLARALERPR